MYACCSRSVFYRRPPTNTTLASSGGPFGPPSTALPRVRRYKPLVVSPILTGPSAGAGPTPPWGHALPGPGRRRRFGPASPPAPLRARSPLRDPRAATGRDPLSGIPAPPPGAIGHRRLSLTGNPTPRRTPYPGTPAHDFLVPAAAPLPKHPVTKGPAPSASPWGVSSWEGGLRPLPLNQPSFA